MHSVKPSVQHLLRIASICCLITPLLPAQAQVLPAQAQEKKQKSPAHQADEVVRVNTELVQTDVTVLDKQGHFVDGLQREQFELSVDRQPQAISFFDSVLVQRPDPDNQPADSATSTSTATRPLPARDSIDRGRVIFFFIDDVHLVPENLIRARKALLRFVDHEMRRNDQVAIVSTSGQIGFLQQLTDNQIVLRQAVARLNNQRNPETYAGKVPISEYDAAQVSEHFNRELFNYLVAATVAEYQTDAVTAANIVQNRVHQIGFQSHVATVNTLGALLGLMRSSAPLPGRKIVFFMTDGFVADPRASNVLELLRQVTKTAAQVGAVVYPMDARGTFSDPGVDATENRYPDFTGHVSRNLLGESTATQEPLQILASDTGGRAFINSNSFEDNFARALDESSSYYLLAWRPEREEQRNGKSRITVTIKGRPDLRVRVRRGFVEGPTRPSARRKSIDGHAPVVATPDEELRAALGFLYVLRDLPVTLSVGYMKSPKGGMMLQASMQIDAATVNSIRADEGNSSEVDVLGVALDDRGSISSFKQKLTIDTDANSRNRPLVWNQQLQLVPGLYQVRVAVRERKSGRAGSAMQWLEVPDLAGPRFYLSSLFLAERNPTELTEAKLAGAPRSITVSVDHRFARGSVLRFQTYVYNAEQSAAVPDVEIQARILRDDTAVIVSPLAKLPTDTTLDQSRLPYWAEIALDQLAPGRYILRVTAIDRRTRATAIQEASFTVE